MSVVPPKDKAFLDIKLVQECMDNQSKLIAIAFGDYLAENYRRSEIGAYWYDFKNDPDQKWKAPTSYIYKLFIESITK